MEGIIKQSFMRNIHVLQLIGLYPTSKHKHVHRTLAYIAYVVILLPQFVLTLAKFVKTKKVNDEYDNIFITIGMLFLSVKFLCFMINSDDIKNCVDYFDEKFVIGHNKRQREMSKIRVTTCRKFCSVLFVAFFLVVCLWLLTLKSYYTDLPLDIWSPVTYESHPTLYFCIYVSCVMAIIYIDTACSAVDSFVPGLLYLGVSQLQILKEALENVDVNANEEIINPDFFFSKPMSTYEYFVRCARHYNDILEFVKKYESCFSAVVFIQFSESIVAIGLCCLQIIKEETVNVHLFISLNYLFMLLLQVYLYCYFGTILVEENNTVSEAIYMGKWYEYDLESKKILLILMERSKRPLIVTAGNIVEVSLTTFTTILRRSYSVICVFKN